MKKLRKIRKERGAIMVMTAVMLTVLLGFTALSIDIGMHHYLGAKLQNAADAAALAAGTKLDADEQERVDTVYEYLAKNGYSNRGEYKDKVHVKIDYKGIAPELASTSTYEYEEYISKGLMRVTVDVDDSTFFASAIGINSLHLQKVSYVLIQPNYEGMPEALKYSIFAGARWGDLDSSADNSGETKYYIDARNPAMDIQGSTGAGSGETAFTTVVAVAESAINGVNDFVQNFKSWMNSTFGTTFTPDYNKLVNINVSEAVMNNDVHSNSNILIGVQALNTARSKDNDYTGEEPIKNENEASVVDTYSGRTDADDYGAVHFTAVEGRDSTSPQKYGVKFGYSRYAEERAAAATAIGNSQNFIEAAGHSITYTVNNYLNQHPEYTRVYVQNLQNVQAVQHAINILNEMDLDDSTSGSFKSAQINDDAGDFEIAAKKYFKVNNKISTQIQNKVLEMETDFNFDSGTNTITLNNQESIVYRVNQKVADEYLSDYASIEVDFTSTDDEQRKSRLEKFTERLVQTGYDKLYKNNNSAQGLLYANFADTDGGEIKDNATEYVTLERYETADGKYAEKYDDNAILKYAYTLNINGKKVNRNMDNVEKYKSNFSSADVDATNLGAEYGVARTFREKSEYIDMPNLRPFFVRQINQSVRDATKKRDQFDDGETTGDKSVKLAVNSASEDLEEVTKEVKYSDSTYQDADKYDKEYAPSLIFSDFKSGKNSSVTKLGNSTQQLGGVDMSNHSYKGYELYKGDGTLKKAIDFVNEYYTEKNNQYGHNAVNAYAMDTKNGAGNDYNAVSKKKIQIRDTYHSSVSNNSSFAAKQQWVEDAIHDLTKPSIPDIDGNEEEEQNQDADRKVEIATPTNPLANNIDEHKPEQYFLGDGGRLNVRGGEGSVRADFNYAMTTNQVAAAGTFNEVTDAQAKPATLVSGYAAANVSMPGKITLPDSNKLYTAQNNSTVSNYLLNNDLYYKNNSNQYVSNISNLISTIAGQYSWDDYGNGDDYQRYDDQGGHPTSLTGNETGKHHGAKASHTYYKENSYNPGNKRGFYVFEDQFVYFVNEMQCGTKDSGDGIVVDDRGVLMVGGGWTWSNTIEETYSKTAVNAAGRITVRDNAAFIVNGDVVSTEGGKSVELGNKAVMIVNGSLKVRDNLTVGAGAILYVTGNIFAWNSITNHGTIICGGEIRTTSQDLTNNGTLKPGSITVGKNTTRWLYNNGTVETTGDVWINGQLLNNSAKGNIATSFTVGGNLTTKDVILNNPGSATGYNATLRVNGTIDTNYKAIYNNYDNNSGGSTAYIYVNTMNNNCGALYNYQPSRVIGGSGGLKPSGITNKDNCRIKTNGEIDTGTVTCGENTIFSSVGNMKVSQVTSNGGAFGCGGDLTVGGTFNTTRDISVGGEIKGTGEFTCKGIVAKTKITAKFINTTGTVRTNGSIVLTGDLTIGSSASVTSTGGNVSAANIVNNNSLMVNGSISATGKITNKKNMLCVGTCSSGGDTDNGENSASGRAAWIKCFGNMTVGGHLDNYGFLYVGKYENGAPVSDTGALTVTGSNGSDSISSFGSIYACGDIQTNYENYLSGTNVYTLGNFVACKSGGQNLMHVLGTSNIYIRGLLTTSDSQSDNKHIWMNDGSNTVLSVLGNGVANGKDCFNNKLEEFNNQQQGSYVYLGTNLYITGVGSYTDDNNKDAKLVNAGRMYVNGSISAPNALAISLYGYSTNYSTENNLSSDDSKNDATFTYGGITYCKDVFNAPNATIIIADEHLLYVEDPYVETTDSPKANIIAKSIFMKNDSVLFSPNTATITEDLKLYGNAVVNIRKKIETTPYYDDSYNTAGLYTPVTIDLTGAPLVNITSNIVFDMTELGGEKKTSSLRGTGVKIKVIGNLNVTNAINLTNSILIVTGNLTCGSLTLNHSNLWVQGSVNVTGNGAVSITNGSLARIDNRMSGAGNITVDQSTLHVTEGVSAVSLSLNNRGQLFVRDDNLSAHDDHVELSGGTTLDGQSQLYVDGKLFTNSVSVDNGSELLGYIGVIFPDNATADVLIDQTTHGSKNSMVFFGDTTKDTVKYNLQVDGTLYLPGGKHFGKDAGTYPTVWVHDNGQLICDSRISSTYIQVGDTAAANGKALLYCAGIIALKDNNTYTNYGRLYAYGGTDVANAHKAGGDNDYDFTLLQDGSETFFGEIYNNGTKQETYTSSGYYTSRGTAYIDANLNITGKTTDGNIKVGRRDVGLYMPAGAVTYVSGSATFNTGNATRIEATGGFVTGGDFNVASTIWNYGKLHVFGAFNLDNNHKWPTDNEHPDTEPDKGWSFKNGNDSNDGGNGASFLAYNYGNKGSMITFKGYVRNSGVMMMNYPVSVEGWRKESDLYSHEESILGFNKKEVVRYAFVNYPGATAQFGGEFRCNSNRFFNKWRATFGCDGRLGYGEIAYNCGQMFVGGDLTNADNEFTCRPVSKIDDRNYKDDAGQWLNVNSSPSRSFAFMNGAYKIDNDTSSNDGAGHTWKNATLYVGGKLQLGNHESQKKAGSLLNQGTMYVREDLKVYGDAGNDSSDTGSVYYQTAIWAANDSNTFVGGSECYGGGAVVTGKNSIFMCDGDLRARRPLKVNMWFKYYNTGGTAGNIISYFEDDQYKNDKHWLSDSNDDGYRACYMRVGGNVYANIEGMDLDNNIEFLGIKLGFTSTFSGDTVPYDSSRDIDIQANANILIDGSFYCPQKLYLKQNCKLIIAGKGDSIYDANGNLNWKARALDELDTDARKNNPTVFGPGVTATLTRNVQNLTDWIRGKTPGEECVLFAYMLLDMNICSKLVVHGNAFVRDTCKIRDMTKTYIYGDMLAKSYFELGKSLKDDDEDATMAHSITYREPGENDEKYVFKNAGYMYVAGNMQSTKYTKVYASTTLKVGGDMQAGDWTQILGNPYITLRHDARLFVGGNMRAYSSIDCGAYSELYVGGNCTAFSSNVKLRDQMTCSIGGDLTAATYIELGKYDENFYRGIKSSRVEEYLAEVGDTAERPENDGSENDVFEGGEFAYDGDEHERTDNDDSVSEAGDDNVTETETTSSGDKIAVGDASEYANDDTDLAVGSDYYIGGNIISFTKYIREYAYSRVVSGGYVLAVQHVTLRHNADMWVLPEVFGKTTYHTQVYTNQADWDTSKWEWIKGEVAKISAQLKQTFEPKAGSIYALGQLSMNKNSSIFGTYDAMVFGQTTMRKGALVYVGHDFDCWAPMYNLQTDVSSFSAFMNSMKANFGLSETNTYKGFDTYDKYQKSYHDSKSGNDYDVGGEYAKDADGNYKYAYKDGVKFVNDKGKNVKVYVKPIVIYANNEINIATSARIRYTYMIANRGSVNFTNLNFVSETSEVKIDDAKELPNAFASYQGDVNFYALRGTLGALMYAPVGNIDLDGFAYDFYGSMVGHTIDINTFYINVHRFNNWRTMDLHIATSKKVYLIPQETYDNAEANVDDLYMYGYDSNQNPNINEWARPFFFGLENTSSSEGGDQSSGEDDD